MTTTKVPNFYRAKPLFGLDIGTDTLKIVQLKDSSSPSIGKDNKPKIMAYGYCRFDKSAMDDGVIVKPDTLAASAKQLMANGMKGRLNTNRVAMAIPANRAFSRSIKIPNMSRQQVKEAVELEAEQYLPLGLNEIYLDYQIVRKTLSNELEIVLIAIPRKIVDSYMALAEALELEAVVVESTLSSSGRIFSIDKHSRSAAVIIDFGALSSDISIFDKDIIVSGTVEGGGVSFTELIRKLLKIPAEEAEIAKTRYGLNASKKQGEIKQALEPILQKVIKETKRMLRYYEDHYGSIKPIKQIVTLGGGSNMPGLSDYLTENLRLAVRHGDPWQFIDYKKLGAPPEAEKSMYTNALGLALISPERIFSDD